MRKSEERLDKLFDFQSALLEYMTGLQIPEVTTIKTAIATVEQRAGISVQAHLGFGQFQDHNQLKNTTTEQGNYFGELDPNNKATGRGINIYKDTDIYIGHFQDGSITTGKFVCFSKNGDQIVGEMYL